MASKIFGPLYLGNIFDAIHFDEQNLKRLCVLETKEDCEIKPGNKTATHIPILVWEKRPKHATGYVPHANPKNLNKAAKWLDKCVKSKKPCLITCMAGIERSPLTIAWWLHKKGWTYDEAYEFLKSKRPEVQNRQAWLYPPRKGDSYGSEHVPSSVLFNAKEPNAVTEWRNLLDAESEVDDAVRVIEASVRSGREERAIDKEMEKWGVPERVIKASKEENPKYPSVPRYKTEAFWAHPKIKVRKMKRRR